MKKENFNSELSEAKGLGAAGTGTVTWIIQRFTAIALVPLVIWFAYFMIQAAEYRDFEIITSMFISPFTAITLSLFIGVGIYHGNIGMKEIIEDYVHCHSMKTFLIILLHFFSFISGVAGVCAILVLHLSTFGFN